MASLIPLLLAQPRIGLHGSSYEHRRGDWSAVRGSDADEEHSDARSTQGPSAIGYHPGSRSLPNPPRRAALPPKKPPSLVESSSFRCRRRHAFASALDDTITRQLLFDNPPCRPMTSAQVGHCGRCCATNRQRRCTRAQPSRSGCPLPGSGVGQLSRRMLRTKSCNVATLALLTID